MRRTGSETFLHTLFQHGLDGWIIQVRFHQLPVFFKIENFRPGARMVELITLFFIFHNYFLLLLTRKIPRGQQALTQPSHVCLLRDREVLLDGFVFHLRMCLVKQD